MTQIDRQDAQSVATRREFVSGLLAGAATVGLLGSGAAIAAEPQLAAASKATGDAHPLKPGLLMLRESLKAISGINDYSASFYKEELVGKKRVNHHMELKVREVPFSVYIKYRKPHDGREAIYVEGLNGGNLVAHGTGLEAIAGTLEMLPTSSRAMEESRYPITLIGMRKMLGKISDQWESELAATDVRVRYFPNAKVGTVECRVFESVRPERGTGIQFHMTRLYINKDTSFPVRVEQFGFPEKAGAEPTMLEQYTYLDVKTDIGLKDIDFDRQNPAYGY